MSGSRRSTTSTARRGTREHILEVALELIKREGLAPLTVRTIAEKANVNVAAVNYHFGSKDALVNEVLLTLTAGLRAAFDGLADAAVSPQRRLERFFAAIAEAVQQHPEIYRFALASGQMDHAAQRDYLDFVRSEGMRGLRETAAAVTGETDDRRLMLRIVQAIGGLVYPLLIAGFVAKVTAINLEDHDARREHVDLCVRLLTGSNHRGAARTQRRAARTKTPRR